MLGMINGRYANSKHFLVSSDGAEEEKMETETEGQQSEKVTWLSALLLRRYF